MSLFPQFGAAGGDAGTPSLVSFKAGKMAAVEKSGGKFLVTPDKQKGQISLVRGDDQLIHFQWKNRQTGAVVDDLIIFPEDASFKKVDTGRQGDRVYLLQYKSSSRRFFFWMQDAKSDKDDQNATKVHDYMNNPPQPNVPTGQAGGPNGQLDQNMLMQMLGAFGGGQGEGGAPTNVQMSDLQNILQNMGVPPTSSSSTAPSGTTAGAATTTTPGTTTSAVPSGPAATSSAQGEEEESEEAMLQRALEESLKDDNSGDANAGTEQQQVPVEGNAPATGISAQDLQRAMSMFQNPGPRTSLARVLEPDQIAGLLMDPDAQNALLPMLPESRNTLQELEQTIRSPQFRQGVASLSSALNTGNYNAIISNFGLSHAAGADKLAAGDAIGAFLAAIQDWAERNK